MRRGDFGCKKKMGVIQCEKGSIKCSMEESEMSKIKIDILGASRGMDISKRILGDEEGKKYIL